MKFYLAPMEGITTYIYRNAYYKFFNNIDKYFAPFIVANKSHRMKTKELKDIQPENNKDINLVPQILTKDAEDFIITAQRLMQLGYKEINLNLGCPAGTVVSKGRGSGFLAKREELDRFLDQIYKMDDVEISIKTRIGKDSPDEFYELIKIYNKYPVKELIIHPRIQKDFYGNKPNLEVFKYALSSSTSKVVYNGDIFTANDYKSITDTFPEIDTVMLGRGIIANPGLINSIKNNTGLDKKVLRDFHDEIFNNYIEVYNEEKNAIFKMKELWGYMINNFSDNKKYAKKIKKAQKLRDYNEAISGLFEE